MSFSVTAQPSFAKKTKTVTLQAGNTKREEPIREDDVLELDEIIRDGKGDWTRFDDALEVAEYGVFQAGLLLLCGCCYGLGQLSSAALRFTSARLFCDLDFHQHDKWLLNVLTISGMLTGSVGWSVLADIFSRRWVLLLALGAHCVGCLAGALATEPLQLAISRLITSSSASGVSVCAAVLLAEFQLPRNRGSALCYLQAFWILAAAAIPGVGWQWRWSLAASSVLAGFLLVCTAVFLPESPRWLISKGRWEDAKRSLCRVFCLNTGLPRHHYPVGLLVDNETVQELEARKAARPHVARGMRPHHVSLLCVAAMQLLLLYCHHILGLWHRDLLARGDFLAPAGEVLPCLRTEPVFPGKSDTNHSCSVPAEPKPPSERDLLVAFSCLPAALLTEQLIDTVGRRWLSVLSQWLGGALVAGSRLMSRPPLGLVVACLLEVACTVAAAAALCLSLEVVSTRRRAVSVGVVLLAAQAGVAAGHYGVATGTATSCITLIVVLTTILTGSGLLVLSVPDTACISLR